MKVEVVLQLILSKNWLLLNSILVMVKEISFVQPFLKLSVESHLETIQIKGKYVDV